MEKREKKTNNILGEKLKVINIGLELFYDELKSQGVEVLQVDWAPPAGGDKEIAKILESLI